MKLFELVKRRGPRVGGEPAPERDTLVAARRLKRDVREAGHVIHAFGLRPEGEDRVVVRGVVPDEATREAVLAMLLGTSWVEVVVDRLLVTPPEPPPTDEEPPPPHFLYTVQPGDTLTAIARRLYGSDEAVDAIVRANRFHLLDPSRINCGQVLRMPPRPQDEAVSGTPPSE